MNRIIVVGGGYAGVSLLDKLKDNPQVELVLIDKSKKHILQTHIHKYLSGYYDEDDITFNLEKYCEKNGIEFICDKVIDIRYDQDSLIAESGQIYFYDYIVVSTGSKSIFPNQIENVNKYTKDIKDINNLNYYRDKFFKMIESKEKNSILVVGGGVSGLQIACEYAYHINKNGLNKNIEVTIVEGMSTLLPGMNKYLIQKARQRCEELGVKLILNLFASKIYEDRLILSNGDEVPYDMLLFVIGAIGNPINSVDEKIKLNKREQIVVDNYYKIGGFDNAFAMGDIVEANDIKAQSPQAPTAQGARMQAELIAKNIFRSINYDPLLINNISNKGILIDLGGPNCAIGSLFNFNISGKPALWLKKLIYSLHAKKFN